MNLIWKPHQRIEMSCCGSFFDLARWFADFDLKRIFL